MICKNRYLGRTLLIILLSTSLLAVSCRAVLNEPTSTPDQSSPSPTVATATPGESSSSTPEVDAESPSSADTPTASPLCGSVPASIWRAVPEDHACTHMQEGPYRTATASVELASAPDVSRVHTRFDVTLVAVEGGLGGFVRYTPTTPGYHALFLSDDVPVQLFDATGAPVCVLAHKAGSACPAAISHFVVMFLEAGHWYLLFGPTPRATIGFAIEGIEP